MSLWGGNTGSQYGIGDWLRSSLGFPAQQGPQPRQVPSYPISGPATVYGAGTPNVSAQMPPTQTANSPVPQPQGDPLDRFERLARMMDLGERVGGAFDKGPMQTISSGGGVAHPQLPQSNQYGLSILR